MATSAPQTPAQSPPQELFATSARLPIPKIYFNGFAVAYGQSDVTFVLQVGDAPVAFVSASYETAKTLSAKLASGIEEVEKVTATKFFTTEDFQRAVEASQKK